MRRTVVTVIAIVVFLVLKLLSTGTGPDAELNRIARKFEDGEYLIVARELRSYVDEHPDDELAWTILGNTYRSRNADVVHRLVAHCCRMHTHLPVEYATELTSGLLSMSFRF